MSACCGKDGKIKTDLEGGSLPTGAAAGYVESKLERALGCIKPV